MSWSWFIKLFDTILEISLYHYKITVINYFILYWVSHKIISCKQINHHVWNLVKHWTHHTHSRFFKNKIFVFSILNLLVDYCELYYHFIQYYLKKKNLYFLFLLARGIVYFLIGWIKLMSVNLINMNISTSLLLVYINYYHK